MTAWTAGHDAGLLRHRVLSLNFHVVPRSERGLVDERVRRAADLGRSFDPDADTSDPQVLIGFYDGDRDTGLFGAELCHGLGLRAFFFPLLPTEASPSAFDDDDLAQLGREHELCFHTATHRAAREISEADVESEVRDPVRRLTAATGRTPRIAAWRGGGRFDPTEPGNAEISRLGVRFLVSNWSVEPLPVRPDRPGRGGAPDARS